jgi:hypothetical protein
MRRDENLSHYESCLLDIYEGDPGVTYDLTQDELLTLLGLVGEEDSVVDAILKNSGASKRERAEQLGLSEADFDNEDREGDQPIHSVSVSEEKKNWQSLWKSTPSG